MHEPTGSPEPNPIDPSSGEGKSSLGSVARRLEDPEASVRADAAWELGGFQWLAVPYLSRALGDLDPEVRRTAAMTLAEIGPEASEAVPGLILCLSDPDSTVRVEAANTLGAIGVAAASAAQALAECLSDDPVALVAAVSLGRLEEAGKTGLVRGLDHPQAPIRSASVAGLGELAGRAADVVPALLSGLRDPEAFVRLETIRSLGRIAPSDSRVTQGLLGSLKDEDPEVRRGAAAILGDADLSDPTCHRALEKAQAGDEDETVRLRAEESLRRLRHRRVLESGELPGSDLENEGEGTPPGTRFRTVADRRELAPGVGFAVRVGDLQLALFPVGEKIYALENACSHANARLSDGLLDGSTVTCTLHWARFDLRTGRNLGPPAQKPVRSFPVRVEGDTVQVALPLESP